MRPAPRIRSSVHRVRSRATAEATASETSSKTAGGQRLGEGAQGQQLAVEDALGGEGAGAVEDGAVAAYQVVADRGALGGALPGEPQDLRIEVGDRDVLGQCHVDPAVRARRR